MSTPALHHSKTKSDRSGNAIIAKIKASGWLYLFLLPAALYIIVFRYIPIYGAQIAFRDYFPGQGILKSPWVGFHYFRQFINSYQFARVMWNTVILSLMDVIITFPLPIIFAIGLHYITRYRFKKSIQMITYAPYFISTIVLAGIILVYLSPRTGPVNVLLKRAGFEPIFFMGNPRFFRSIYVGSSIWQLTGYNAIIYIAVLSSVNPELHESALIDGANKLQRIIYIDFPVLLPTTSVLLILRLGRTLRLGFEKAYALQTALNISKSEIIETFVYKLGIEQAQFSYAAAVGLFMNVINFAILLVANQVTKKVSSHGLF
jgi:putative aldouronate transport system permease protein